MMMMIMMITMMMMEDPNPKPSTLKMLMMTMRMALRPGWTQHVQTNWAHGPWSGGGLVMVGSQN